MTDKLCCPECGTHIDEHEAGECIDAWAAKDVMEWKYSADWNQIIPPEQKAKPDEMWSEWYWEGYDEVKKPINENHVSGVSYGGDSRTIIIPKYSTDIAAAWVLVEKVADLHGCQFSIERVGKPWEIRCGKYGAVVSGGDLQYERPDLTLAVYADSAPLAITRAAIKATAPHG